MEWIKIDPIILHGATRLAVACRCYVLILAWCSWGTAHLAGWNPTTLISSLHSPLVSFSNRIVGFQ